MTMRLARWKRWVGVAAGAGLLAGCASAPLYGNPELPAAPRQPPVDYFQVNWWAGLVDKVPLLEYSPREPASPVYDPESRNVVVQTRDGYVRAVGPDGKVAWSLRTGARALAGGLASEGVIYLPGGDGVLYALDGRTGAVKWKYATNESLATVPVLADGLVLVATDTDTVFAVKATDGTWVWQYRRDPPSGFTVRGASAPRVDQDTAYIGFSDGFLVALKVEDGGVVWEKSLSGAGTEFLDVDTTPAIDSAGRLYVASYKNGLYALEADTGAVIWNASVGGLTSLLARGEVVFATGDGRVDAYLGETGKLIWSLPLKNRMALAPVLARGMLLVPNERALLFVDPTTGKSRMAWNPGVGISAPPFVVGSRVYVLSNNAYLYALDMNDVKKGPRG
ncbi:MULTISPECIES: outer membrane protein assembly factor BamB family protein [unclassified Corallococcus]|uniref:outer membrane protein assembly factor BamB family protein n=1 Tax=unclassified Corallococcus TaxID=2685029 RepID=UPI001A903075|nr:MULTISPECIES: PQQ-binding-like beta-propeller repeat protein [unclassified Corallococcus]MBN9685406.1 PQQ-binding-like beta-propeller repeat protein [Corallococcus sp. NCSPR001]WAS83144.1 PQQ-binding-like beta-propeller repeat protein [Corallococcus sp. NCRR]